MRASFFEAPSAITTETSFEMVPLGSTISPALAAGKPPKILLKLYELIENISSYSLIIIR